MRPGDYFGYASGGGYPHGAMPEPRSGTSMTIDGDCIQAVPISMSGHQVEYVLLFDSGVIWLMAVRQLGCSRYQRHWTRCTRAAVIDIATRRVSCYNQNSCTTRRPWLNVERRCRPDTERSIWVRYSPFAWNGYSKNHPSFQMLSRKCRQDWCPLTRWGQKRDTDPILGVVAPNWMKTVSSVWKWCDT